MKHSLLTSTCNNEQSRQITAKPVDGLVAKVRLKPGAKPRTS